MQVRSLPYYTNFCSIYVWTSTISNLAILCIIWVLFCHCPVELKCLVLSYCGQFPNEIIYAVAVVKSRIIYVGRTSVLQDGSCLQKSTYKIKYIYIFIIQMNKIFNFVNELPMLPGTVAWKMACLIPRKVERPVQIAVSFILCLVLAVCSTLIKMTKSITILLFSPPVLVLYDMAHTEITTASPLSHLCMLHIKRALDSWSTDLWHGSWVHRVLLCYSGKNSEIWILMQMTYKISWYFPCLNIHPL